MGYPPSETFASLWGFLQYIPDGFEQFFLFEPPGIPNPQRFSLFPEFPNRTAVVTRTQWFHLTDEPESFGMVHPSRSVVPEGLARCPPRTRYQFPKVSPRNQVLFMFNVSPWYPVPFPRSSRRWWSEGKRVKESESGLREGLVSFSGSFLSPHISKKG
jgi:hypothetical protein